MTINRNFNSRLRKISRNFICGFCLGVVMGILGAAKNPGGGYDQLIFGIIFFGLIFGAISAILGQSFWRFGTKRKTSGFPQQTDQSVDDATKNDSVQQDSIIP